VKHKGKILITGANGLVGSALVAMLNSQGFSVVPLVRTAHLDSQVDYTPVGDLLDFDDWEPLLQGVDVIIHLAAKVHQPEPVPEQDYFSVNVDATIKIASAARQAGIRRFIYLSTVKVNGEVTANGEKFSGSDQSSPQDAYARSKWQAEKKLQSLFAGSDTDLVIIRPPLVYGDRARANFRKLERLARLPFPLPFAAVRNRRDMVSVLNLCELIALCCQHSEAAQRIWMVADEQPYSLVALISEMRALDDRAPWLFYVPLPLLKLILWVLGKSALSDRLFANLEVDSEPTRNILGWHPVHSFAETMRPVDLRQELNE